MAEADAPSLLRTATQRERLRALITCCAAHILHDGFTDLIYVLLPVWQAGLGLSLAEVGVLRTAYTGVMAGLQLPASVLAERIGERRALAYGTALASVAYLAAGWASGFVSLLLCLGLGGAGSSVQHPIGASITARAFSGRSLRTAISTYNFAGDIGKVLLPAIGAGLVALWKWHAAVIAIGVFGIAVAAAIPRMLGPSERVARPRPEQRKAEAGRALDPALASRGFRALSAIGIVDATTRTGFLTYLPFLMTMKGADLPTIGLALSLTFAGGATGKFACGVLARRAGVLRTVILTECATSAFIVALLFVSNAFALLLLPFLGMALNGTSSVLYGTVAELAPAERRGRAFGTFYSITIGAGAVAPAIYGVIGDAAGVPFALGLVAAVVLLVLPLSLPMRAPLAALDRL